MRYGWEYLWHLVHHLSHVTKLMSFSGFRDLVWTDWNFRNLANVSIHTTTNTVGGWRCTVGWFHPPECHAGIQQPEWTLFGKQRCANFKLLTRIPSIVSSLQLDGSNLQVKLPLPLLISSSLHGNQSAFRGETLTLNEADSLHELVDTLPHELLANVQHICPFLEVMVEAPVCSLVTRSKFHVEQEGVLRWIDLDSLPERNCALPGSDLPADIFLELSTTYNFIVHFVLNPDVGEFYYNWFAPPVLYAWSVT